LVLLQTCFVVYRQVFLTFEASKSLKLFKTFLYSICVLNDFKLTSFGFEELKKFEARSARTEIVPVRREFADIHNHKKANS